MSIFNRKHKEQEAKYLFSYEEGVNISKHFKELEDKARRDREAEVMEEHKEFLEKRKAALIASEKAKLYRELTVLGLPFDYIGEAVAGYGALLEEANAK